MRDSIQPLSLKISVLSLSLLFLAYPAQSQESSASLIEEIIVTSQRTEESLQDVPIAVTALTGDMLEDMQIESGSDLQMITPSLSFQGGDAGGGTFNIRGITNLAVSATSESGVEIHVNDLPVGSTTMQDGEFFDMERIEVLRGPQGTLYGKNSVGGAINLITARPVFGESLGKVSVDTGSFDLLKTKLMVNVPLGDSLAMRIATSSVERDGDIKNIYSKATMKYLNGRDSNAFRLSLAWQLNDSTDILLVHDTYEEDSSRHYVNNRYCKRDPSVAVGCTPGAPLVHELTHPMATFVENLAILTGILDYTPVTDMSGAPKGFWESNNRGNPRYIVDQDITQLIINHSINDNWDMTVSHSRKDRLYDRTGVYESEEYDRLRFKDNPYFPGGNVPMSGYGANCTLEDGTLGSYGGCLTDTLNYPDGFDRQYNPAGKNEVTEMRFQSNLNGNWNYLLGAIHTESSGKSVYDIAANGLDALALFPPGVLTGGLPQGYVQLYAPLYRTSSISATRSSAIFGEIYYQPNDRLKYTLGLRRTEDYKEQYGRSPFLSVVGFGSQGNGFTALPGQSIPEFGQSWYASGTPGDPETEYANNTGRFVVDYALNDNTLVYGSISKGFKGGGFNPALDPAKYPNTPQVFPSTELTAFEVGFKADFPEQGMRWNAAAYLYDAEDYQVTKIQNKTRVNEGIDVDMMGFESEFIWVPLNAPQWQINMGIAWEESEIASGEMIMNPANADLCLTTGCGNWHLMKNAADGEVFVVRKDVATVIWNMWQGGLWGPLQALIVPAEFHGDRQTGEPTPVSFLPNVTPGHLPSLTASRDLYSQYMVSTACSILGCNPADAIKDGLLSDIGGNTLTHPELSMNLGVQYTMITENYNVNFRLDAYKQDERYTTLFDLEWDKVPAWTEYNAMISITPAVSDPNWRIDIYGQNITDEQNIMHIGEATAPLGFNKSIWAREQSTYGVKWTYNF
ncbi:TonB-dependent receptor [Gammaproteobacteria bacterium]|jgi:iron complex outermembrane receptor protein|nr:TonB-dependent receptor [Gammaproteobacteria bacterium]MDB4842757.1 TonB-dependent receptor [Gammaproteobacteria bacterium]MDB9830260.1 TonB-dependent receptor [Gammaproteobacteria bacterium]MDB9840968.1 TonB-dependent receptor [Gammaproteobacteria bacterium]MDC1140684.1 TonB-dependent receptor [Gammaproteobacteria bacterium]